MSQEPRACSRPLILHECLQRWRRETRTGECDTGRYCCRYVAWGSGPPLMIIPGTSGAALGFVMLMARLQSSFRCISYQLPDGATDGARLLGCTHDDLVDDLLALLDHLNIAECALLGVSFGSTIALKALHGAPDRFNRAILQGGFAYRPLAAAEVFCASWCRFLTGDVRGMPFAEHALGWANRAELLAREPDAWTHFLRLHLSLPLRALGARLLMIHRLDLRPLLPAIRTPVLMVCGERDPLIGKACEAALLRDLPSVARAEIEQCGHLPHLTHPEVLAEIVTRFASGEWNVLKDRPISVRQDRELLTAGASSIPNMR